MTDYPYDPELPYVVTWEGAESCARFPDCGRAADYAQFSRGKVINTTPKPKIPADAEFIHWVSAHDIRVEYYARKVGTYWLTDQCYEYGTHELLAKIGDAEVVALKRA